MDYRIGLKIRMLDNLIQKNIYKLMNENNISDITYMNYWVINYIHECAPREVYQRDIEQTLAINRATASKMLTTMEEKGLISREVSNEDGRLRKIVLKPEALVYHERHKQIADELEVILSRGISQDDMEAFLKVYTVMKNNLEI